PADEVADRGAQQKGPARRGRAAPRPGVRTWVAERGRPGLRGRGLGRRLAAVEDLPADAGEGAPGGGGPDAGTGTGSRAGGGRRPGRDQRVGPEEPALEASGPSRRAC